MNLLFTLDGTPVMMKPIAALGLVPPVREIIILGKTALRETSPFDLARWRDDGNTLIFDEIDGRFPETIESLASGFLCASRTEFELRQAARVPQSHYVPHAIDLRVRPIECQDSKFRCVYVGAPANMALLTKSPDVEVIATSDAAHRRQPRVPWAEQLPNFSHHYIVREPNPNRDFKPFTKGFLAAAFHAPVIASASDPESLLMLGSHYPYLAKDSTIKHVTKTVDYARETLAGSEWTDARMVMKDLAKQGCALSVAQAWLNAVASIDAADRPV